MDNLAIDNRLMHAVEELESEYHEAEVVNFDQSYLERDSLSENFVNEIEAWARQALESNGFGDF